VRIIVVIVNQDTIERLIAAVLELDLNLRLQKLRDHPPQFNKIRTVEETNELQTRNAN